jgi:hypothetical protein
MIFMQKAVYAGTTAFFCAFHNNFIERELTKDNR